jgi:hypothetical protein
VAASKKAVCGESLLGSPPYGSARRRALSMPSLMSKPDPFMVAGDGLLYCGCGASPPTAGASRVELPLGLGFTFFLERFFYL